MFQVTQLENELRLSIHVTPNAKRSNLGGTHDDALRVAVTVVPEKGKANKAVIALLADHLGIRKGAVQVVAGTSSRRKVLSIVLEEGALRAQCIERLEQLASESQRDAK